MRIQAACDDRERIRLILAVLVPMLLLAGAAQAAFVTEGQTTKTDPLYWYRSIWASFAFVSTKDAVMSQGEYVTGLCLQQGTNLTFTVHCGFDEPNVYGINSISFDLSTSSGHTIFTDNSGGTTVSWSTGPMNTATLNGSTLSMNVAFKTKDGNYGLGYKYTLNVPTYTLQTKGLDDLEACTTHTGDHNDWILDSFDESFNIHVVQASPGGCNKTEPAPDVEVRVLNDNAPWNSSDWITTDAKGDVVVPLGKGDGPSINKEIETLAQKLYLVVDPVKPGTRFKCDGYLPRHYSLPQFARFSGCLEVLVKDIDKHPLSAMVSVWGGRLGSGCFGSELLTDKDGRLKTYIAADETTPDLETKQFEVTTVPRVNLEKIHTQLIDWAPNLVTALPCYISPRYTLHPDAYTYAPSSPGGKGPYCSGGEFQLLDGKSGNPLRTEKIKVAFYQDIDLRRDDRQFFQVPVTQEETAYRTRVIFNCPDSGSGDTESDDCVDGKLVATGPTDLEYLIQATREEKKQVHVVEWVGCGVGAWAPDPATMISLLLPVPSSVLTPLEDTFKEMFPGDVDFVDGGLVVPWFWPWQNGPQAVRALCSQLQDRQRTRGVDLVVGLVPPGWLQSWFRTGDAGGVQSPGINGAVLIDPTAVNRHGALHEFIHTLGQEDDEMGNYLGLINNLPPSTNGYREKTHEEIINLNGKGTKTPRVMYPTATDPWLSVMEHGALMDYAYKLPADSFTSPKEAAAPKAAPAPCMRLHGYFNLNGKQAVLDPVFTTVCDPYNPYVSTAPASDMFYVELLGAGQAQLGVYYIPVAPPKLHFSAGTAAATRPADLSLEARYSACFDFSVAAEAQLTAVRLGYAVVGYSPAAWKTFNVSANSPVLQWVNEPAGTLDGPTAIEWTTSDPDGADIVLAHEFHVSFDGGATWRQMANSIPSQLVGDQRVYSYNMNPAGWPVGSQYRFKVLASDGLRTTELVNAADVTVNGYDPNPKAELLIAKWEAGRPETGPFTVPIPLHNGGHDTLELWADPATLPGWLSQTDAGRTKIDRMSDGLLLLSGNQNATGTFETTITLNTNDPDAPTLTLPVKLIQEGAAPAPRIARIELDPEHPDIRPWQPGEVVHLTLWDNDSRPAMEAMLTINQPGSAKTALVTDLPLEAGSLPGEYRIDWTIPADAADGDYGFEFTLRDPAADLNTKEGSHSLTVKRRTTVPEDHTHVMVPNFEGQSTTSALSALTAENLVSEVIGQCSDTLAYGYVISQSPAADQSVPAGGTVKLTVSNGPCNVVTPNLVGRTQAAAEYLLTMDYLAIGTVTQHCSDSVGAGLVISQNPAAYASTTGGSAVAFVVSSGPCVAEGEGGAEGEGEGETVGEGETEGEANPPDTPAGVAHDLRTVFNTADADHSGGLSLAEAMNARQGLTQALFSQLDGNADGQVTPEEINLLIPMDVTVQDLVSAFATADADHSGGLSEAEFGAALPGLTHDQFVQLDTNGDGQLTLDELNHVTTPGGCTCTKSSLTLDGLRERMADLFLLGLALTSLLAVRGRRP